MARCSGPKQGCVYAQGIITVLVVALALLVSDVLAGDVAGNTPSANATTQTSALSDADLAALQASIPGGMALLSYNNGPPSMASVVGVFIKQNALLTVTDWLPEDISSITTAWSATSSAKVKKVWLGRDYVNTTSKSSARSPFAVIELASGLSSTAATVPTGRLRNGVTSGSALFQLIYADPSLFPLGKSARSVWKGQVIGEVCAQAADFPDRYCARPAVPQVSSVAGDGVAGRMGFLAQMSPFDRVNVIIGIEATTSAAPSPGSEAQLKTFIRPGLEPHKSFLYHVLGTGMFWAGYDFLVTSIITPKVTTAPPATTSPVPSTPVPTQATPLSDADLATLRSSIANGTALLSYGNGSLSMNSAPALMVTSTFLITMTEWLPENTDSITTAWTGTASARVKNVWLGRDFESATTSNSSNDKSPFAVIELEGDLNRGYRNRIHSIPLRDGQTQSDFVLLYADPSLSRLGASSRLAWNGPMIGDTCAQASENSADKYCAKPASSAQVANETDFKGAKMGFLALKGISSMLGMIMGVAVPSNDTAGVGGSQGLQTFIRPGLEPHKSFLEYFIPQPYTFVSNEFSVFPVFETPVTRAPGTESDAPSHVFLYEDNRTVAGDCDGVQIADQFVLTTASCVQGRKITHASLDSAFFGVDLVLVHPRFDPSKKESVYDVAVLRLGWSKTHITSKVVLDTFERKNGTELIRMELGGRRTVDSVQVLPEDQCDSSSVLDGSANWTAHAGRNKWCVADASSVSEKPVKNAALFFHDKTSTKFTFVGFQLHPHLSNRFISVLDVRNFVKGSAFGLSYNLRDDHDDGSVPIPQSKKYLVGLRIKQNGQNFCGGSLIASTYVLTAAHCVFDGILNWVTVGSEGLSDSFETIRVVPNSIKIHPQFGKPYMYSNDAAIFQIESSPITRAVTLDNSTDFVGNPLAKVFAYSTTSSGATARSNFVKEISLPVWSRKTCAGKYPNMDASVLCAGGQPNVDACQGDSGSPLTFGDNADNDNLIGIVGAGYECGQAGVPGFYTRVSSLVDFIERHVVKATWKSPHITRSDDERPSPKPAASANSPAPTGLVVSTPIPSPSATSRTKTPSQTGSSFQSVSATASPSTTSPQISSPQANAIVAKQLEDLSPVLQSKVVKYLVDGGGGGISTSSSTWFSGIRDRIVKVENKVTLYSSGDLDELIRVIEKHDALPLNQRIDRFGTALSAASSPENQICVL